MHEKLVKNGKRWVWTPEQVALLGTLSDAELARELGCAETTVAFKRRRLKIPPAYITATDYPRRVGARIDHLDPWTPEQYALLGKASDSEVAKILNRTLYRVQGRRKKLGIPSCRKRNWLGSIRPKVSEEIQKLFSKHGDDELRRILKWDIKEVLETRSQLIALAKSKNRPWTKEEDELLGTESDVIVARKLKRSVAAVMSRRRIRRLRIRRDWTSQDDAILGTRPDEEVAKLLNRPKADISWRRSLLNKASYGGTPPSAWTAEEDELLQRPENDEIIAKELRRSVAAVHKRRRDLKSAAAPGGPLRLFVWTPARDALLGTGPDSEIAVKLGTKPSIVAARRRRLKIWFDGLKRRRWSKEEESWLGKLSDEEIAARMGIPLDKVVTKRERMTREGKGNFSNTSSASKS